MKTDRFKFLKTGLIYLVLTGMVLVMCACAGKPVERSGVWVKNQLEGAEETKYVYIISKGSPNGEALIRDLNEVIKTTNVKELAQKYMDYKNRRGLNPIGEIHLFDNTGDYIYASTCVLEPFNFSGAGGAYADGVDVYMISKLAEMRNQKLEMNDLWYQDAMASVKNGSDVIGAMGIALTDELRNDFLVSDVYLTGYQQIISDANEKYTKLSQLKGLRIGVLSGRPGEKLVSEALAKGVLRGSGAEMVVYNTDAEAGVGLNADTCDVLILDEMAAEMLVTRGF